MIYCWKHHPLPALMEITLGESDQITKLFNNPSRLTEFPFLVNLSVGEIRHLLLSSKVEIEILGLLAWVYNSLCRLATTSSQYYKSYYGRNLRL